MDYEFKRMDFDDVASLANYGEEILVEMSILNDDKNLIVNANVKDTELEELISSIPKSIGEEIDEAFEDVDIPVKLSFFSKMAESKSIGKFLPKSFRNNIKEEMRSARAQQDDNANTIVIYNKVMDIYESIKTKLQSEVEEMAQAVETLTISQETLKQLLQKFDLIISVGEQDIEAYENSEIDDPLKSDKLELARTSIAELKIARLDISGFIQKKDLIKINLFNYAKNLKKWLRGAYAQAGQAVASSIESKYIESKIELLNKLNGKSNDLISESSKSLVAATQRNVQMLSEGSIKMSTVKEQFDAVNQGVQIVTKYLENKGRETTKLLAEINTIQEHAEEGRAKMLKLGQEYNLPQLGSGEVGNQKVLKIGAKTNNND